MYATKLGVRTPRVLYCGVAKDLPQNISSFGQKYVVKPLEGWNANGVKVIKDGVNILKNEKFSFDSVLKEYKPDQPTVVEELIESAHPKFENLVPPDYKFFVYEGRPEIMFYVDRNKGQYCADFFDVSSRKWKHLENFTSILGPNCPPDKYDLGASMEADMTDAVRILASSVDKNWIRIDMFDSRNGPTLGEFTPYSTHGKESPLVDCVMSYLFIAHSEHHGGLSDDAVTVKESPIAIDVKNELKIHSSTGQPDPVDFFPPEAKEWEQYDQLEKCKKVMEAQRIQN